MRVLPVVLLLGILLLGACSDPSPPVDPGPPRRVVSLLPAWTEIVVGLGEAGRLVACSEYCEPGRDLPRVGWQDPRAAEQIARLKPDLVLRQRSRAARDPLVEALRSLNVRVLELPSETIADVREAIAAIAEVMGRGEEGATIRERFDAGLDAVRESVKGRSKPRVLFIYNRSPGVVAQIGAAGPGNFIDELIGIAGGVNVLADAGQAYVNVDLERLLRAKVDVVIDNLPPEEHPTDVWARVKGLESRVVLVTDNRMLIPGPRLPAAAEALAELIHDGP
ncbi:MAG: ABC transporter substrate-binding protein [Planctomycetota bacterium]